jgi:outer membrane receptor protein involved in Fe transport
MSKSLRFTAACLLVVFFSLKALAQPVTISGTVRNTSTKDPIPAVSVTIKGTPLGTYTDDNGNFSISTSTKFPLTLVLTHAEFDSKEIELTSASSSVEAELAAKVTIGQEVVVAAARSQQRILEAPVTIERLSASALKNAAAPSYYEALANLKGVDVHTASLTFRTVTTRGFVSSGNTRLNQLVDGMDNQAPGLNFSVSAIVGLTELDVDNIEILSGASSALYGSGGMNGTVLISSKNPFKYQGLSFNIKQGLMHADRKQGPKQPYYNWSLRWAKAINNKVAFKITGEILRGSDWQAEDYQNKAIAADGLFHVAGGNRVTRTDYNGINTYGDETSINMDAFSYYVQDLTRRALLTATANQFDIVNYSNAYWGAQGNPMFPTNTQRDTWAQSIYTLIYTALGGAANPAADPSATAARTAALQMFPFYNGRKNGYYGGASVTRTGYNEEDLVDYNTLNVKVTGGLHWKINERIEASWTSYFGTGTSVYTGANRYSLKDFKVAQHKLEVKAKDWFVRGYTTQENAGGSYIGDAVGAFLNETARPSGTVWFPNYIGTFSEIKRNIGLGNLPAQTDISLHNTLRQLFDYGTVNPYAGNAPIAGSPRFLPGTSQFIAASNAIKGTSVNKPGGSKFLDRSDLWAAEAQLNFSDALNFSDKVEMIAGAQWKQWVLNSKGTIFSDTAGTINVNETGGYVQLKKKFFKDILTLTATGRYDKQTNFKGKFTPRIAAVIQAAKDHFFRLSYQSAYRFPVNQDQYISLKLGGGTSYLIGSLPEFQSFYQLNSSIRPGYTIESVLNYRAHTLADSNLLKVATFKELTPETVKSYEVGYKGLIGKKLLFDAYFYYSRYEDFLVNQTVGQAQSDNANWQLYSSFSSNTLTYRQNTTQKIKSVGWGVGIEYNFYKKYILSGNIFSDKLKNLAVNEVTFFNAPNDRVNLGLRNDNVYKGFGFNVIAKWQDVNYYEGTFVAGSLPAFIWLDAQASYRLPKSKSMFRIGATNVLNHYARTGYGSPAVGGLYYVSYGYNIF